MKGHQMLRKLRESQENEEGFTLIELLVVVIIIGILAAIAIPAFLNQRERAWQAELTSTVRNVALEVEAAATAANGDYSAVTGTQVAGFITTLQSSVGDPVQFYGFTTTPTGFSLCAQHDSITARGTNHNVSYNSATGGLNSFVSGTNCSGTQVTS